jgi:hypothetical protein
MLLNQIFQLCGAELQKAQRAATVAYKLIREADDRALQTLLAFFQNR